MKEIGERVKERMIEIQPRGFKYIVLTQINENLGQGGRYVRSHCMHGIRLTMARRHHSLHPSRADLVCHWEDSDAVAQEVYANDSIICICVAFAVRTI
ncbi:hypothetical protein GY45DRAFT_1317762 [Cubamyces sp. BRFM 1775]|nr:hypothetical protein GY45DRAFT_1317762 [Cubamyces sp. BRFM 1775]